MSDIIKKLKESGNEILSAEARSAESMRKLKHTKSGLETLLANSIAEIEFKPLGSDKSQRMLCSSNIRFVNTYKTFKKTDKEKQLKSPFTGIHTKESTSVDTYDLIDGRRKTISLKSWKAVDFVQITEENVLALDALVNECLKRNKVK